VSYPRLSAAFRAHHRHPVNVALHLVTTPLGAVAALRLLSLAHPLLGLGAAGAYALSLAPFVPRATLARTLVLMAPIAWASLRLHTGLALTAGLLALAYVAQDLAHALVGERTLQGDYDARAPWLRQFAEHTYFLLPLCADAAAEPGLGAALLGYCMPRSGLLTARLTSPEALADLDLLRDWAFAQKPPADATTHWWAEALPEEMRAAYQRISGAPEIERMFRARYGAGAFAVEAVRGMNEVYVATLKPGLSSDAVFYARHIDGPFMLYPFAAVHRCIVAVNGNAQVRTVFPMTPAAATWTRGDVGAFDFNREPHYVEHNPGEANSEQRITLKLHYCVAPRVLPGYGRLLAWLNVRYDQAARAAFLKALRPATLVERALARAILMTTAAYGWLGRNVGGGNLAWLGFLAGLNAVLPGAFLVGTSFVHYLLYIATYYLREGVSFHAFRRDAVLYKALAAAQLAILYARNFELDSVSLALIATGLLLSALAAKRLGWERTYFGAELGLASPERVTGFPYGVLRHPMITGNVLALLGLMKMAGFRHAAPWLAPTHIAFYLAHLLQEHFDVHASRAAPEVG
jgi:uncharacterized membrane protein YGL010W